jgi:hypothetical protein
MSTGGVVTITAVYEQVNIALDCINNAINAIERRENSNMDNRNYLTRKANMEIARLRGKRNGFIEHNPQLVKDSQYKIILEIINNVLVIQGEIKNGMAPLKNDHTVEEATERYNIALTQLNIFKGMLEDVHKKIKVLQSPIGGYRKRTHRKRTHRKRTHRKRTYSKRK